MKSLLPMLALVGSLASLGGEPVRGPVMSAMAFVTDTGHGDAPVDTLLVRDLPVSIVRSSVAGTRMAVLITGDGGYVSADRALAESLAESGVPVVVLNARAYLSKKRSPEESANDVSRLVRSYLAPLHRDRIVLVGYSRGADIMPFIANRMPDDLKSRIELIALLGPAPRAGFEFHWRDLLFDTPRATDLPVLPELERLRGTPMLCIYGDDERDPMCKALDPTLMQVVARDGRHRISHKDAEDLARTILAALPHP
jgi:type IV secretory pathway VirJ component